MRKNFLCRYGVPILFALFFLSCNGVEDKANNTISHAGRTIGKGTTEFVKGVKEGIDKTLGCSVNLAPSLTAKGVETGKFIVGNTQGASVNELSVYFIFNKNFSGTVVAKVTDKTGQEYGRASTHVDGKQGDAHYVDFVFDKRTDIENRSTFTIE